MSITVCLPAREAGRVEAAVEEAMAPFEIDYTRGEDLDIWDFWVITGGSARGGGFHVLPGHERDPRLVRQFSPMWPAGHEAVPNEFGWCAGGPREILDFSGTYEGARALADSAWLRWQELAAELPPAQPWAVYHDRSVAEFRTYSNARAGADHRGQPLVRAFEDYLRTVAAESYSPGFLSFSDPVAQVGCTPREDFVAREAGMALPRRNVLTLQGWWYDDGYPDGHGACHGPDVCPHEPELPRGQQYVDGYLAGLPGDTLLVNVWCHV